MNFKKIVEAIAAIRTKKDYIKCCVMVDRAFVMKNFHITIMKL